MRFVCVVALMNIWLYYRTTLTELDLDSGFEQTLLDRINVSIAVTMSDLTLDDYLWTTMCVR